jgi:hypothetical protein
MLRETNLNLPPNADLSRGHFLSGVPFLPYFRASESSGSQERFEWRIIPC